MNYNTGIGFNKEEYADRTNHKIVTVKKSNKIINYLFLNNNIDTTNQITETSYPDGIIEVKLGRSITPKYFKLEYICIPTTFYQQSNPLKRDTRILQNEFIQQNAPLRIVWREQNGGPVTLYNLPLEPGNYTMDEFILAVQTAMNTSIHNQYTITFNEINLRSEIRRVSGTYEFALFFDSNQKNQEYFTKDQELFISAQLGYNRIPFLNRYTSPTDLVPGLKVSPLIMDLACDPVFLLDIEGTPSILSRGKVDGVISPSFNATFLINNHGNKGDYNSFTINKDFENKVVIANKITYESLRVSLREFVTGQAVHLNGNSPYIVFSYEEYDLHENFSIN